MLRWSLGDEGDPYAIAAEAVGRATARRRCPTLPPFTGGAVGFFGYDLVRTVETTLGEPNPDVLGLPDMALMLSDVLVVFDHLKHTVTILVNVYADERRSRPPTPTRVATIAKARAAARRPGARGPTPTARARACPTFSSNMPREAFEAMVARIVEYVHAGDAFQVVPSQRWSAELDGSTRSPSTAGCASSTRRPTCTSWTSWTSRSPAPAPSRC